MVASTQRIRGFDGLRAIAFLLVFVSHKVLVPVTEGYGTAGVWLFFVLSGFLITRIMLHSRLAIEQRGESQLSHLMDFWVRRSLRIFPVYYAFLASMTLLSLVKPINLGTPFQQLSNFIFLSNVYIEFHGWPGQLGHLWSLSVEEQFYILFAPMALGWLRLQLGYICAGILLVSVITHAVLLAEGSWSVSFDVNSFVNFGLMAIGGLAGLRANRALPKLLGGDIAICINFCTILRDSTSHVFGLAAVWAGHRLAHGSAADTNLPKAEWLVRGSTEFAALAAAWGRKLRRLLIPCRYQCARRTGEVWLCFRISAFHEVIL